MKHESQTRQCSVCSPDREVWSSAEVQKQVGQTIVQLPHDRHRLGDVVPARMLGVLVEQGADVRGVHRAAHPPRRVVDDLRRRPGPRRSRPARSSCSSTPAPRSLPARARKVCSPSSSSVSARS